MLEVDTYHIPVELQQRISGEQAYQYRIVPFKEENGSVFFYSDTLEPEALSQELLIFLGYAVTIEQIDTDVLNTYLSTNFRKAFDNEKQTFTYTQDFLEKILLTAKAIGSSDIHFEPFENRCRIRFRLDGKLKEQYSIAKDEYPVIINKIKNQANLDISQNRLPQDGRITVKTQTDEFDIRVSTLPTLDGESIVLRILSKDTSNIHLDQLGFTEKELQIYKEGVRNPNGIVLISGPTGSGKTTTLYATLKLLNKTDTKILTIEDPIEYTLEGVMQMQLKEEIGLNFETALKTFLRQDPDIIMVGEIRDVKTANMAIRAALTGHLVLSTIHTNSAWGTISRLIDMGVPAHLIASTLNLSVAQRLVRKLCIHCKKEMPVEKDTFPINYKVPKEIKKHYTPQGCSHCYHTGYLGRKAIYELLPITKDLTVHIKNNETQIDQYLEEKRIKQLSDQAIHLIQMGETSVDDVFALLANK
ncbi:general secretion pathway protein GspE [Dokdonia pacifica]|uniref:Type IV pilus assembly protein PilB n=1 Tax=Dokdonia pacifica TaxID=1627892 RepID=A0A239E5J0_9FLAO|nr:GspE/PulE family protein [Dokdonia pacifica]GGG25216.1 general secretion pathway protein GspE [Dokdonia pacifica]SNS39719.1 type IV pilus assembly protein PilB [Dokdonia pacifica]